MGRVALLTRRVGGRVSRNWCERAGGVMLWDGGWNRGRDRVVQLAWVGSSSQLLR
jgi:hypothetical protein